MAAFDFPSEWDLSEIHKLSGYREKGRPAFDGTDVNRFYGDIWLLEQIARESGIRKDLELVRNFQFLGFPIQLKDPLCRCPDLHRASLYFW